MLVSAFSDVLTMNFFWMVRDEGSWLDIGSSISHFCIASLLCVFVAGLEVLSEVFVSGVRVGGEGDREAEGEEGGGDGEEESGEKGGHTGGDRDAEAKGDNQKQQTPAKAEAEVEEEQSIQPQIANGEASLITTTPTTITTTTNGRQPPTIE